MSSSKSSNFKKIRDVQIPGNIRHITLLETDTNIVYSQIIFKKSFESQQDKDEFFAKMSKIAELSVHPALLHIKKIDILNQSPTILTEYQSNGTLSNVILNSSGPDSQYPQFNGTKKLIVILGIALSMQFYYLNYAEHGNLTPDNIFLDDHFYPHVLNIEKIGVFSEGQKWIVRKKRQSADVSNFALIIYELITNDRQSYPKGDKYPDLRKIESKWLRIFLMKCLSDDSSRKPIFENIFNELFKNKSGYQHLLGAIDEEEVSEYIKMVNDYSYNFSEKVKEKADQGDIESSSLYGDILYIGVGVESNMEEAAVYYKKAADKGKTRSMYNYGLMLTNGDGIQMDKSEAAKYFKMAADLGVPIAMNNYGIALEFGEGVPQNVEESVRYYKMAADMENPVSLCNYAMMLKIGKGIDMNKEEALKYFKIAADNGVHRAMYNYSDMLIEGDGIDQNVKEGLSYLKMAADQGYTDAIFYYASCLYDGIETDQNLIEAASYFKFGAELDDPDSMLMYGRMLFFGDGVEMNKFKATSYVKMAAYAGNEDANELYKEISEVFRFSY